MDAEKAEDWAGAIATYTRLVEVNPGVDHWESVLQQALEGRDALWSRRGDGQFKAGNLSAALEWYRKANALEKVAEVEKTIRQQANAALQAQAMDAEAAEDWAGAIAVYTRLVEENPGEDQWESALRRARDFLQIERRYLDGCAASEREDWALAQRALADVVYLRPDYKDAAEGLSGAVRYSRDAVRKASEAATKPPKTTPPETAAKPPKTTPPAVPVSSPEADSRVLVFRLDECNPVKLVPALEDLCLASRHPAG
jgi:tetratricopeptide (TPR) repeat protein